MQFSRLSILSLFLATVSLAANVAEPLDARDVVVKAAGAVGKREHLESRTPKKKVKGSSGSGEEDQQAGDDNAASSIHLNIALAAGAGAIAISAMML